MRDVVGLRRALLGWYRRHQRDLPWRRSPDPYKVWVSEIMLQQTQVAAATPYYERFVAKFPDVRALARADRARVMALWAGLGYYRRARHLHEAAGIVVREHDGRVPSDPRAFGSLPGVGRYTLGAVLSMGFGLSWPVLDGNVARVISRLTARPLAVKRPADAKKLWALAAEWMSGDTTVGFPGGTFTLDFDTVYLLGSYKHEHDRISARVEQFSTSDSEDGHAWTVAWFRERNANLRAGIEYVHVSGERPGPDGFGVAHTGGSTLTIELRYQF